MSTTKVAVVQMDNSYSWQKLKTNGARSALLAVHGTWPGVVAEEIGNQWGRSAPQKGIFTGLVIAYMNQLSASIF